MIVWDSKTGNVERFVEKLNIRNVKIHSELVVDEPYLLVTFTTGFGLVPETTQEFLKQNKNQLSGVASSGNRNWKSFAKAADTISSVYGVPVIHRFELSGTTKDVEIFLEGLRQING